MQGPNDPTPPVLPLWRAIASPRQGWWSFVKTPSMKARRYRGAMQAGPSRSGRDWLVSHGVVRRLRQPKVRG